VWLPSGNPYGGYSVNPALGNGSTTPLRPLAAQSVRRLPRREPAPARSSSSPGDLPHHRCHTPRPVEHHAAWVGQGQDGDQPPDGLGLGRHLHRERVDDYSTTPVVNVVGGAPKGGPDHRADASRFNVGTSSRSTSWRTRAERAGRRFGSSTAGVDAVALQGFPRRAVSRGSFRTPLKATGPSRSRSRSGEERNVLTIYDSPPGPAAPPHRLPASQTPRCGAPPAHRRRGALHGLENLSVWSAAPYATPRRW